MKHSEEFLAIVAESSARVRECTVDDVVQWRKATKPIEIIDVREDSEWNSGHIAGAIHLGRGVIERDIVAQLPDKNAEIVLYCGGGFRSALAADNLQRMGYACVWSMAGGWKAWTAQNLPTESP